MQKVLFSVVVCTLLTASLSVESFADSLSAESRSSHVATTPNEEENAISVNQKISKLMEIVDRQVKERLEQLWSDVEQSIVKNDFKTAIPKLTEIVKLDKNSEAARILLDKLEALTLQPESESFWTPGSKAGERRVAIINNVEFAFRWCPAYTFMMGSTEKDLEEHVPSDVLNPNNAAEPVMETVKFNKKRYLNRIKKEERLHHVTLSKGFWMLETEVTQKQWKAIMDSNPSAFKGDFLPVETVSWNDCQEFCKKSAQFGLSVQLPTEAQWEYACRAGHLKYYYPGSLSEMTWFDQNSDNFTRPVGTRTPNAWGFYDMLGNVSEWCQDWFGEYSNESVTDPTGSPDGTKRVFRGENWSSKRDYCRPAQRDKGEPGLKDNHIGLRLVISATHLSTQEPADNASEDERPAPEEVMTNE